MRVDEMNWRQVEEYLRAVRAVLGDGNFGGHYERSDAEMLAIWDVAVAETRALIEGPWS